MLSPAHAEQIILELVQPLDPQRDIEVLDLPDAADRVLAELVTGSLDFPHWDNSAMDGYAVRYEDVQSCSAEQPVTLDIIEEIPAGYQPQYPVNSGQAARILTGSVMPAGADTVVMQEDTERQGDRVTIQVAPNPNAFVRHQGSFYQAGSPLLPAGLRLQAPEIAVLAAAQCPQVKVYRRPRVAILSTGSELVQIDEPLQPGQIVDSNQYALAALVRQAGAEPLRLGIVPDQPDKLKQAIAKAITHADVVLSSGGVSVGDYDYIDRILEELGAEIYIRRIAIKPGKPLTVAVFAGKDTPVAVKGSIPADSLTPFRTTPPRSVLYFGLPGNPVSALVTFWRFVQPSLRKLSGLSHGWQPTLVNAKTLKDLHSSGDRETYLWGQLRLVEGVYEFDLVEGSHSSGNLINLAGSTGLGIVPLEQIYIAAGESIQVLQL